jgi:hypothetical protein
MLTSKRLRRGRIGATVTRPTAWWLQALRRRAATMYDHEDNLFVPVAFASDAERIACGGFFNAALVAEQSGASQAERLAADVRRSDPELAECLRLYGAEEAWHRDLVERFLRHIGCEVRPIRGVTRLFYDAYANARELETIMLTNLMFEVIGSTTYRIALGRAAQQPAIQRMLTILARDESFHVPLNVHFIREMLRQRAPSRWRMARLRAVYHVVFWLLIASAAASRPVAQPFDHISFAELARAYAENLSRLFLREADLRFSPPSLALRCFGLRTRALLDGEDILSAAAAEASADRDSVAVTALVGHGDSTRSRSGSPGSRDVIGLSNAGSGKSCPLA